MKKRILIPVACLILLSALILTFFVATGGRHYEEDGVWQNSRIYFADIAFENGEFHCTYVNKTWRKFPIDPDHPDVQRRTENGWETIPCRKIEPYTELGAFRDRKNSFQIEPAEGYSLTAGEYRLIDGALYASGEKAIYVVGYLTVTEDMLS